LEQQRIAAATLSRALHLDPEIELVPQDNGLVPLRLLDTDVAPDVLVQGALASRPELKQSEALVSAAHEARDGALYGPLLPSIGAQVFAGGLGGGHDNEPQNFGSSQDYLVGVNWRLGPGGMFDLGRIRGSEARLAAAELHETKLKDAITAEVI